MSRDAEKWYTITEAAEIASMSEKHILRQIKAEKLDAKRPDGRRYRISASALDAYTSGWADA